VLNELTDGTGGYSVDTTTVAAIRHIGNLG
jgi:hypothetical protein